MEETQCCIWLRERSRASRHGRTLDFLADVPIEFVQGSSVARSRVDQRPGQPQDRVTLLPLRKSAAPLDAYVEVFPRPNVSTPPVRHQLQQSGSFAPPRSLNRGASPLLHYDNVVAIERLGRHPVRFAETSHPIKGLSLADMEVAREEVVLANEEDR